MDAYGVLKFPSQKDSTQYVQGRTKVNMVCVLDLSKKSFKKWKYENVKEWKCESAKKC